MAKQKTVLFSLACFSLTLLAAEPPSPVMPRPVDPKLLRGLTEEEARKKIEDYYLQQRRKQESQSREYLDIAAKEAWKRLLDVTDAQWQLVEPKYRKANDLDWEQYRAGGAGVQGSLNEERFYWRRPSKPHGDLTPPRARDEMTEGQRIIEDLVDLLEYPNSTDAQIRKKIDDLHQARENARKALPNAKQELAAVLTTPRQEAVFLIMGYID